MVKVNSLSRTFSTLRKGFWHSCSHCCFQGVISQQNRSTALLTGCILNLAFGLPSTADLEYYQKLVDEINSSNASWKAGFKNTVQSFHLARRPLGARLDREALLKLPVMTYENHTDIPDSFDGRLHWRNCPSFRHISNQGDCGTCWAVSSAGALSDRMCVFTNGTRNQLLSADELVSCCSEEILDCGSAGCDGGDPVKAWDFFHSHGIVTGGDYGSEEGCQPYSVPPETSKTHNFTCHRKCTNNIYNGSFVRDHYRSGPTVRFCTIQDAQKSIMKDGSIVASFSVYPDFMLYKEGIYHHVVGEGTDGHSVRVVGWGVENGVDYWLVANSWGTRWGDRGWFKIRRGQNECGFEEMMVAGSRP